MANLRGESGHLAEVTPEGKLKTSTTVGAVGVGETYGMDLYPSAWITLGGSITTDNWVKITIDSYDSQYTIQAGDTWEDIVAGLVNAINSNNDVKDKVDAFSHYKRVFIRGEEQGDKFEGLSISTSVSSGASITSIANDNTIKKLWKEVLIEEDEHDRRFGRIGVFGEVGSRTKAENPIHICVRKSIATQNEIVFADKIVPSDKIWYITNVAVADDNATEFKVYHGTQRDYTGDSFTGDGSTEIFALSYGAINNANYIEVKIDSVVKTLGSDYDVIQNPNDETKSNIVFTMAQPPANGSSITVTYDTVILKLGLHVIANDSKPFMFGAPIKMEESNFLVVSVQNKSANAGIAIANINGFYEDKI